MVNESKDENGGSLRYFDMSRALVESTQLYSLYYVCKFELLLLK